MTTQVFAPAPNQAGRPPSIDRRPSWRLHPGTLVAALLAATVLLVFVLPLFVPSRPVHGISASYLAGFNNSVAVLGAAGLSVAVLLFSFFTQRLPAVPFEATSERDRLGWRFTGAVIACSSAILALAGAIVIAAKDRYLGDAGYIIEQASTWSETGRKLYSQVEFAYGPLLLMPEAWVSRLAHLDMTRAYFVVLVLESALGLLMVAALLNYLPIHPRLRRIALALFALGAITPHLGLNYTFFRFASPLFFFLVAARKSTSPWVSSALFCVAVVMECAISPELSFALAAGCVAYAGLRAWQTGPSWLITGIAPLVALTALLLSVGHDYLHMVSTFSQGVYNLPIGPYPHVLILLFALVWLVPMYVGRAVRPIAPESASLLGLYTIALAMMPAALRRCDPLHVFFNGVGLFALSMAAVSQASRRMRTAWIICFALFVLWEHRVNEGLFSWRTAYTLQRAVLPRTPRPLRPVVMALGAWPNRSALTILRAPAEPDAVPDMQALGALVGNQPIAAPLEIPPVVEAALKQTDHYGPLFHAFGVDVMDDTAERASLEELRSFQWMLLPTERKLSDYQQLPSNIGPIQGIRMYFRLRNTPVFVPGRIFEAGVARDWTPVQTTGPYTLYRRNPAP